MEIKYSSSPWGFRFYPWEKYCRFISSLNFKYVCAQFGNAEELKKFPLTFPDDLSEEKIKEILKVASDNGLKIIEIGCGGDFSVKNKLAQEIELTKKRLNIAAKLGAEFFIVFAGAGLKEEEINDSVYRQTGEGLSIAGDYARQYGIKIVLENHGGLSKTPEQLYRILKEAGTDNVGLNYDPANFYYYGGNALQALEKLSDYVFFTHLKGCKIENGKTKYCRLKDAEMDYPLIIKKLLEFYSGYYLLEYEEPSDVEEGSKDDLEYLKEILK